MARSSSKTILALGLAAASCLALAQGHAAHAQQGYWQCRQAPWSAYTEYRKMEGLTSFECGGICGDNSHTQPTSWVDITGGISQSQEDHSDTFFGPLNGEWNGCAASNSTQVSTGAKWMVGINQGWDRWPHQWGSGQYGMEDLSFITGSTGTMNTPYGSIYDLDCAPGWISWIWGGSCPKNIVGTIYWDNFPVTAYLAAGNPVVSYDYGSGQGYVRWNLVGDTGVFCSIPEDGCQSVVCSDLHVRSSLECTWEIYNPCEHLLPNMEIPSECI
jgi:hypothetical protein